MPDRVIRDEILHSDRWADLPRNSHRLAFVCMLLRADDFGNIEATPGSLWRLWQTPIALKSRDQVAEILEALLTADLIRLYQVDGKSYAHIPRFRQRLRHYKRAHPQPPTSIEGKEIKDKKEKPPDERQADASRETAARQSYAVRSEEKGSEEKGSNGGVNANGEAVDNSRSKPIDKKLGEANPLRSDETLAEYNDRLKALAIKPLNPH